MTWNGEGMDRKTKALYLCIKRQLRKDNHPVAMINKKFAEVFCICYKGFVNKSKNPSQKLRHRLDTINKKMTEMSNEDETPRAGRGVESSVGDFSPTFRDKPNYLLTRQIVGDI